MPVCLNQLYWNRFVTARFFPARTGNPLVDNTVLAGYSLKSLNCEVYEMECPHCNEKLPSQECPHCQAEAAEDAIYCPQCGEKLGQIEQPPVGGGDSWDERTLCSDGACIGIIGPDGKCKECGKPYNPKAGD